MPVFPAARLINLGLTLAAGLALRCTLGLTPVWWLAYLAPAPLLVAVLRASWREAWVLATLAGIIGASVNIDNMREVMGTPLALGLLLLQALSWTLIMCLARRVMLRGRALPALLAYPLLWAAFDLACARFLPDNNWGSLGYAQAGFLPAAQVVAIGGVPLLVCIVSLPACALAWLALRGQHAWRGVLAAGAVVAASLAWGAQRLKAPMAPMAPGVAVGLAAIDDAIGPQATPTYANRIWQRYAQHVADLAARGARIVVLPEKIAVFAPTQAGAAMEQAARQRLAQAARAGQVWLVAGVGVVEGGARRNRAWLFAPSGALVESYDKQRLAPGERDWLRGRAPAVHDIGSARVGLAICKDMHVAALGRAYAQQAAQVLAVPSWDFQRDGQYAARLSALRGIEGGFAMVRAARDGLLTVTDDYGRILAETASAALPGATLLARLPAAAPALPPYARGGDLFGVLALALCAPLLAWRGRPVPRSNAPA